MKNYARAVIRKYVTLYLIKKRQLKELLDFHRTRNLAKIKLIQRKYKASKSKPKKLNIRRFKEVFYFTLIGWRVRRILSYIKSLPEMREAMDFIKLRNDILQEDQNDLFSQRIVHQFPEKIKVFRNKFDDLSENAVWIKKPKEVQPVAKKHVTKGLDRSKSNNHLLKKKLTTSGNTAVKKVNDHVSFVKATKVPQKVSKAKVETGLKSRQK